MEIHQLRYFLAAAEAGNITRAAERCRVAQPSLSQQLKKLEDYLGVPLFDRLGRGIALTDAGRALVPRAKRILAELRDTEANLKREAAEGPAALTIGAIPTMAPYLLPPALQAFRKPYPDAQLSVREDFTENLVHALLNHEIDCALVSTPLQHDLLDVELLAEEELLVALPKNHPAAKKTELSLADLRDQPTVTLEEMHCLGQQIQGFCATRHLAPRVLCRTTQLTTILELVALDVGLSLVPEMAAAADRSRRIAYRRIRPHKPTRQIAIAWRQGRTHPAPATRFVTLLKARLRAGAHAIDRPLPSLNAPADRPPSPR